MTPRRVSSTGLELIKRFEGFRARAARLSGERHVIGYGHTAGAQAGQQIGEAEAGALLVEDLAAIEQSLEEQVFTPLSQNQFDALASFVFSIGLDSFRRSDVLRRLNEGALLPAASAMEMWREADLDGEMVVVDALVRRRAAEKALFLTPEEGFRPASSVVLRPRLDLSAHLAVLRSTPEEVSVPLDGDEAVIARPGVAAAAAAPAAQLLGPEAAEAEPDFTQLEQDPEPLEPAAPEPAGADAAMLEVEPDLTLAGPDADEELSAARAAAAAVTARLHEILRGDFGPPDDEADFDDEDEEPELSHPSPPSEPPAEAPAPVEPPAAVDPATLEPFPTAAHRTAPDQPADRGLAAFPSQAVVDISAPVEPLVPDAPAQPVDLGSFEPLPSADPQPSGPYLMLGLVGIALIIGSLVWLFRPSVPGTPEGLSWGALVVGIAGIACVGAALWFTTGREDAAPK